MKVLLVEDSPGDARLIQELLREAHRVSFDVVHVDRLQTGLECLAHDDFDAVLLDLSLPDSHGLDTLAKAGAAAQSAAIIVLTGLDDEQTAIDALRSGAQDYLVKGRIDSSLLVRAVHYATERKQIEDALRESEEKYRAVVEDLPVLLCRFRPDGVITFVNEAYCRHSGKTHEALIGKDFMDLIPETDREVVRSKLDSLNAETPMVTYEHKVVTANGETRWQRWTDRAILDEHRSIVSYQSIGEDITQEKRAEKALQDSQKQLMQSEKMASIGQLAAGVAHEINNPVGFVMSNLGTLGGYVDTFKRVIGEYDRLAVAVTEADVPAQQSALDKIQQLRVREDLSYIAEDVDKLLAESADGTERIRDIVQNLRSFARVDEGQLREADINQGIEATLKIVWNELKYKCNVHKKFGEIPRIRCYPGQLNQVFMNLLVNAAQAIEKRGDITIETETVDGFVVVHISDNGRGIRREHLSRIFDPFFTTKAVGKGTGLGLSISHGIIANHNGTIDVDSEPGKGTTFTIRLPVDGVKDD